MIGLSPELRELVRASKGASLPTEADSARILEALRTRLGDGALWGTEAAQMTATSVSSGFAFGKTSLIGLASLAVLSGVWFYAAHAQRVTSGDTPASVAPPASTPVIAQNSASSVTTESAAPEPSAVAPAASLAAERDTARPAASLHVRDRLAEEVALLSRAEVALHNGRPAMALEVLSEHERKFANGLLVEERIAARAQALCALGRTGDADAQLARLSPNSLHGRASRQACGSNKN